MKTTLFTLASVCALGASVAAANTVALCHGLTYADGYLYCRENSNGDCVPELGDFPVEISFPLNMYPSESSGQATQYSLAQLTNNAHAYTVYDRVLTINPSPGAVDPVEFKQLSAIGAQQTSLYWFNGYGIILWSPTSTLAVSKGGFQMIEVPGRPGIFRQHWNQTLYEANRAGTAPIGLGDFGSYCYSDFDPEIIVA